MSPEDRTDPDISAAENAVQWARRRGSATRIAAHAHTLRARRRQMRVAVGLLCTGLVWATVAWWPKRAAPAAPPAPRSLIVAAPARKLLPDGSIAELREGAAIEIQFGPTARRVVLERGQAHFSVVKDAARPFTVSAGAVDIRSLGTAFAVQLQPGEVEIFVTQGRVAVETLDAATTAGTTAYAVTKETIATLDAGMRAVVSVTGPSISRAVDSLSEQEINDRLAWRVARIELNGTPLADVIEVFDRHGAARLRLADPALGGIALSGVLQPDHPNALLHVLKVDFGVEAEHRPDGEIVLRRR